MLESTLARASKTCCVDRACRVTKRAPASKRLGCERVYLIATRRHDRSSNARARKHGSPVLCGEPSRTSPAGVSSTVSSCA